jgi:tRNA dimethylallyltransferase
MNSPQTDSQPRALLLAGPTAVGKSAVALHLAELLDGEIVSVDSMQVYRELDIGTAKPTAADRARIPHHLIDILELEQRFDAAQFVVRAREAVAGISGRGRTPILCGGTGLYFKALTDGIGSAPRADAALRDELDRVSLAELLAELEARDPVLFDAIDRHNRRRVARAVEVIRLTGQPWSAQRAVWKKAPGDAAAAAPPESRLFVLSREPADLRRRIDLRVEAMFAQGLVAETERALARGLANNPTALQAIGYRQVADLLRGGRSLDETVALVRQRTHQFARRQRTWFRTQPGAHWIDVAPSEPAGATAARIAQAWSREDATLNQTEGTAHRPGR